MQSNSDSIFQQQQQQQQQQLLMHAAALAAAVGGGGGGGVTGTNASMHLGKYSVFTEITQQMQQQQQQQNRHQQNRRHTMGCPPLHQQHQSLQQDAENIPPAAAQDRPFKRGRYEPSVQQQQTLQTIQQHQQSQPQVQLPMPPPGWAAAHALRLQHGLQMQQPLMPPPNSLASGAGSYGIVQSFYPMLQLIRPMQPMQQQQQQPQQQQQQLQQQQHQQPQQQMLQQQKPQNQQSGAVSTSNSGSADSPLDLTMPKASAKAVGPQTLSASVCGGPIPLDLSFNTNRPSGGSGSSGRTERSRKQRRSLPPSMLAAQQQQRQPVPMLSPLLFPSPTLTSAAQSSSSSLLAGSTVPSSGGHQLGDHLPRVDASPEPPGGTGSDSQQSAPGAADDPNACRGGRQPVTTCHQCGQAFVCQGDMNAHFELEHLNALMGEFDNGKSWKSSAVENKELNVEATMVRLENGDTIGFKCPECDYFAKWPTELQKHIMVHSSARPHVCVVCGCTYKWKWDLGRHFDRSHESAGMPNPYKKNSARPSSGGYSGGCSSSGGFPTGSSATASTSASAGRSTPRAPRRQSGSRLASPSAGGSTTAELMAYYSTPARSAALAAAAAAAATAAASAAVSVETVGGGVETAGSALPTPPLHYDEANDDVSQQQQQQHDLACPICGAQARWPAELKAHVVGHSDFRPFRCSGCPFVGRQRLEVAAHLEACEATHPDSTVLCEPPPHLAGLFADEAEVADYAERATRRRLQFDEEAAAGNDSREASEDDGEAKASSLLKSDPDSPEAPSSSVRDPPELPRVDSPSAPAYVADTAAIAVSAAPSTKHQALQVVPQSPCRLECGGVGSGGVEQGPLLQLQ